uniref:Formamidopyrimidine-DNA glycosylase catalytic domain-containing protein n=1 Tax=viral metagenome TaxID=1070528 RepID=A0A6C0LZQ6_9ZZZZ
MPEGPEIHRYACIIADYFYNNNLIDIRVLSGRYTKKPITDLDKIKFPVKVVDIGTKGKYLFIELSNGFYLSITHGMSGTWNHNGLSNETRYDYTDDKHNRIEFKTSNGSIFYNDYRNFGTFQIIREREQLEKKWNALGPDILNDNINEDIFYSRIDKKKSKKIADLLVDQKLISGMGNYLRAEILWYAKISPHRIYSSLNQEDKTRLYNAAYNLARYHTIKKKSKRYPSMNNSKLEYQLNIKPEKDFFVYQQKIDSYGNEVITEKMGGRTIHWVPKLQK